MTRAVHAFVGAPRALVGRAFACLFALCAVAVLFAGCGKDNPGILVDPERPVVEITFSPIEGDSISYAIHINWAGSDNDGQVVGFQYAVDPPASPTPGNDTVWVNTNASEVGLLFPSRRPRNPPPPNLIPSSDYHTFVVRAIDNDGLISAPDYVSFTSFTIAPVTRITLPRPTEQLTVSTTPSVSIEWSGTDPDGTQRPVKYKFRLVTAVDVNPSDPTAITSGMLQAYFEQDAVNFFASWDSVSGDTTTHFYEGLTPGTRYFFAIVAFDEAGAYEPRFNRNTNVLDFKPTLDKLGPRIRVFNEFFSRSQDVGGISLNESRIVKLEFPADAQLVFNWTAAPPQQGALITGYRWAVDIANRNILDETPRENDNDVSHWSTWSLNETSARIGPFFATPESSSTHYFYLEARDNLGFVSLYTIRLKIVKPSFASPLLVVDDLYGRPTQSRDFRDPGGPINLSGAYPLEAEADSFYYAFGNRPDSLYIRSGTPGVLSLPGVFADYGPDSLDYLFYPVEGVDLAKLGLYRVVCWYTDGQSAARNGQKFGSVSPQTAIRTINSVSRLNTLAVYLRQGGKAWLFGEGTTTAIANGYWTRFGGVPALPYTSGEEPSNVLFPGNFLYDFVHIRSEMSTSGASTFQATQLISCIPYLPQFFGPTDGVDRSKDPRIDARPGAGAERTATNTGPSHPGWANLPRLTIANYRGAVASPGINGSWVIKQPNQITSGPPNFIPVMDTLYLFQARQYDPTHIYRPNEGDGYPNALHYYGTENGPGSELVWFGFPLHFFERSQVKTVVEEVMRNLGVPVAKETDRGTHPAVKAGEIVDDGATVERRMATTGRTTR